MTVSFHKFGDFFPGSGALKVFTLCPSASNSLSVLQDIGAGRGKNYAVHISMFFCVCVCMCVYVSMCVLCGVGGVRMLLHVRSTFVVGQLSSE